MAADEEKYLVRKDSTESAKSKAPSKRISLWSHVSNLLHGYSWNYNMRFSVTERILPNFYSASAEAGPLSQSISYVPSTNSLYYSPGAGTGSGISLTAGWATDPNGFAGGPSGSVCVFYGVGDVEGYLPAEIMRAKLVSG